MEGLTDPLNIVFSCVAVLEKTESAAKATLVRDNLLAVVVVGWDLL